MGLNASGHIWLSDGSYTEFRDLSASELIHNLIDMIVGHEDASERATAEFDLDLDERTLEMLLGKDEEPEDDPVSSPSHYKRGGLECKDVMDAMLGGLEITPQQAYWYATALKYLWRWPKKNGLQDVEKCRECLHILADLLEADNQTC